MGRRWLAVKSQRIASMAVGFVPPRENATAFSVSAGIAAMSGVGDGRGHRLPRPGELFAEHRRDHARLHRRRRFRQHRRSRLGLRLHCRRAGTGAGHQRRCPVHFRDRDDGRPALHAQRRRADPDRARPREGRWPARQKGGRSRSVAQRHRGARLRRAALGRQGSRGRGRRGRLRRREGAAEGVHHGAGRPGRRAHRAQWLGQDDLPQRPERLREAEGGEDPQDRRRGPPPAGAVGADRRRLRAHISACRAVRRTDDQGHADSGRPPGPRGAQGRGQEPRGTGGRRRAGSSPGSD